MSLSARLVAVERRQGPAGPYAVLIHCHDDGTTATVCRVGRDHEHMTLNEYRAAFPDGVGCIERWYHLGDSEAQPDRMSARWAARG